MAVLVIDDDATGRAIAVHNLRRAGLAVDEAADGAAGLSRFDGRRHDVVVTDLKMPVVDGMEVLRTLHKRAPEVPVIVITAFGDVDKAVEAMRAGAWSFIEKPFSRDQLQLAVQRAMETRQLRSDNRRLRASSIERPMIAESAAMQQVLSVVDRVAPTDAAVLITGQSGVGKELVARRLHARSKRASGPFVPVNCGAIPKDLLESELFGHVKGAFTGAAQDRLGRFRAATGGTVFLDELAELPLDVQVKLLRVLQEGQVDVVGADAPVPVDVRVVAATNQDLDQAVAEGRFRADLYYRVHVIRIDVPPLGARTADIGPLALGFIRAAMPDRDLALPAAVVAGLEARSWPGNVRELKNACERMAILAVGDAVSLDDLQPALGAGAGSTGAWLDMLPEGLSLMDLECQVIAHALAREGGNVSAAARRLGVPRHVLAYRIEKFGLASGSAGD